MRDLHRRVVRTSCASANSRNARTVSLPVPSRGKALTCTTRRGTNTGSSRWRSAAMISRRRQRRRHDESHRPHHAVGTSSGSQKAPSSTPAMLFR
jgi:hypothetical protein